MDFNKVPKLLSETVSIAYSKFSFFFGFSSGTSQSAFAVPPDVAKGLIRVLQQSVEQYEAQFGDIDISRNQTGIQSPLQPR